MEYVEWATLRRPKSVRAYAAPLCCAKVQAELNALAAKLVGGPLSREDWVKRENVDLLVRKSDVDRKRQRVVSAAMSGPAGIGTFLLERIAAPGTTRSASVRRVSLATGARLGGRKDDEVRRDGAASLQPATTLGGDRGVRSVLVLFSQPDRARDDRLAGETARRQRARVLCGLDCSPEALELRRGASRLVSRGRELAGRSLEDQKGPPQEKVTPFPLSATSMGSMDGEGKRPSLPRQEGSARDEGDVTSPRVGATRKRRRGEEDGRPQHGVAPLRAPIRDILVGGNGGAFSPPEAFGAARPQETARERVRRFSQRILPSIFHIVQRGERVVEGVLFDGNGRLIQRCAHTPMFLLRESGEIALSEEVVGAFDVRYRSEWTEEDHDSPVGLTPRDETAPKGYVPLYRIKSYSKPPYKRGWAAWQQCCGSSSRWPELAGLPQSQRADEHQASEEETAAALVILYAEFLSQVAATSSSRRLPPSAILRAAHLEFHYDRWSTFGARYPLLLHVVGHYHLRFRDCAEVAAAKEAQEAARERRDRKAERDTAGKVEREQRWVVEATARRRF
jgi:hypothetical protein